LGNQCFKSCDFQAALTHYQQAIQYLEEELALPPVITVLYLNSAQCYLKMKQWSKAVQECTKAIGKEEDSVKAWFRRGVAYRELQEFENADKDF
jgi:FK506-binding protein 4/5